MCSAERTTATTNWLSAFPALAAITDAVWIEAVGAAKEVLLPADTTVIREGQPCQNFLLIAGGNLRIYKIAPSGREIMLYHTCGGEVCSLTLGSLLEGRDYSENAITENEVRAVMIPTQYFHAAMARSDAFRIFILSDVCRRMRELMNLVGQVAFEPLELRLACLLGQLFAQSNTPQLDTTHEELARRVGSTRVVTSRLLKKFELMGCISLQRGLIELLSPQALEQMSRK